MLEFFLKKDLKLIKERAGENCFRATEWVSSLENFTLSGKDFYEIISESVAEQGEREHFAFIPFSKIQMLSVKGHNQSLSNLKELLEEAKSTIHKYINAA